MSKLTPVVLEKDTVIPLYQRTNTYEIRESDLKKLIDINKKILEEFLDWAESSDHVTRYNPSEYEYDFDIQPQDKKYIERIKVPKPFVDIFRAALKIAQKNMKKDKECITLRIWFTPDFLHEYKVYEIGLPDSKRNNT